MIAHIRAQIRNQRTRLTVRWSLSGAIVLANYFPKGGFLWQPGPMATVEIWVGLHITKIRDTVKTTDQIQGTSSPNRRHQDGMFSTRDLLPLLSFKCSDKSHSVSCFALMMDGLMKTFFLFLCEYRADAILCVDHSPSGQRFRPWLLIAKWDYNPSSSGFQSPNPT